MKSSAADTPEPTGEPPMQGLARVGSGFAFSTVVQGHQVTAVGEVPAQTVEFIAHSVKSFGKQPAAALKPHALPALLPRRAAACARSCWAELERLPAARGYPAR